MASTEMAPSSPSLEIIVHPLFRHALAEPPQKPTPPDWLHLPRIALETISLHLEAADLCNLGMCCKELHELSRDEKVWEDLCYRKFNIPRHLKQSPPPSWYALYKFNHEVFYSVFASADSSVQRSGLNGNWPLRQGPGPIRISTSAQ